MSVLTTKIEDEISPIIEEFGCSIVRIAIFRSAKSKTLQVMIEKSDGSAATIENCEKVSRAISVCLDVANPISGRYNLEVSSTGINRPLVKVKDYIRFIGKPVVVKTYALKGGRKIFKGILDFANENSVKLELDIPLIDGSSSIDFVYDEISNSNIDGFKSVK
jgi:ribosome maturation factor RimP